MEGYPDPPDLRGIIPNAFQHIFDHVALGENEKVRMGGDLRATLIQTTQPSCDSLTFTRPSQYLVRASYFEIYQEEIRDLLSKDPKNRLELKER